MRLVWDVGPRVTTFSKIRWKQKVEITVLILSLEEEDSLGGGVGGWGESPAALDETLRSLSFVLQDASTFYLLVEPFPGFTTAGAGTLPSTPPAVTANPVTSSICSCARAATPQVLQRGRCSLCIAPYWTAGDAASAHSSSSSPQHLWPIPHLRWALTLVVLPTIRRLATVDSLRSLHWLRVPPAKNPSTFPAGVLRGDSWSRGT